MERWAHIDIAGVMDAHGEVPYLGKGMTGKCKSNLCSTYVLHTYLPSSFWRGISACMYVCVCMYMCVCACMHVCVRGVEESYKRAWSQLALLLECTNLS